MNSSSRISSRLLASELVGFVLRNDADMNLFIWVLFIVLFFVCPAIKGGGHSIQKNLNILKFCFVDNFNALFLNVVLDA